MNDKLDAWSKGNIGYSAAMARHFPTEYMLRALCSPSYFGFGKEIRKGDRVLDLGCLYLNNLMPFADRGAELHGVEINEEMAAVARERAAALNMDAKIATGHNRALPYPDAFFDFVLSINTIHYEDGTENVMAGLREFSRVGKSDCHFLISTVERQGPSSYKLATGEFRDGQVMSYFDNEAHFIECLSDVFGYVEVATITERYPLKSLEFFVAKCRKV